MMFFQAEIDTPNPTTEYRDVLERISKNYKVPTHEVKELLAKVDADTASSSKRYLSEDYLFCKNVRDIGMKVWICPWMKLKHAGSYVFGGSLAALASIGANPTVDESLITKKGM
jgi:predicted lactoylglutathione lyase